MSNSILTDNNDQVLLSAVKVYMSIEGYDTVKMIHVLSSLSEQAIEHKYEDLSRAVG